MPPMWWKLIKIMLLLFALFATIVCINSEIAKRREAKAEATAAAAATNTTVFVSEHLLHIMRKIAQEQKSTDQQPQQEQDTDGVELPAETIDERLLSIFKVDEGQGVILFNSTTQQQQKEPQQQQQPQQQPQRPRQPISDNKYRPQPPKIDTGDLQCADGFNQSRSFCTKVTNYPDISGLKDILMSSRFASLRVDQPVPTEFGLRMNDDEQYLCNSHVRYLYPKLGQRLDLTWQYIVNTDEFKQGILIEECDKEGESCQFLDSFPNNYVPVCKQHYVLRQLATINNVSSGQPEVTSEPFRIPSCCKCVIKSKFNVDGKP